MVNVRQSQAARKHIKKAQEAEKGMNTRQRALAQREGRGRAKPGEEGGGEYFRIIVRPKSLFVTFRYHDVGQKGGDLQRLAGKRSSGSWDTQAWLISKKSARVVGDRLEPITPDAKELMNTLGSEPVHKEGDIFEAKDRPNIPEADKPTRAQRLAQRKNVKKAQRARRSETASM